jgi:hypothetical protein
MALAFILIKIITLFLKDVFPFCSWRHEAAVFQNHFKDCMFLVEKMMLDNITYVKGSDLVTAVCLQSRLYILISVCMIE